MHGGPNRAKVLTNKVELARARVHVSNRVPENDVQM